MGRDAGEPSAPTRESAVSYGVLADAVLLVHIGYVIFVIAGGLLALKWPKAMFIHLPAVLWGAISDLSVGVPPRCGCSFHQFCRSTF